MKKITLVILCFLSASCSSGNSEKKLSIKGFEIGQSLESCPKNITVQESKTVEITQCLLKTTTYAGYETFSHSIEIYQNKIFSVRVEINDLSSPTSIINALTQVYGKPDETGASHTKWNRQSDSLFVFSHGSNVDIRLVNHKLQEQERQDIARKKIKDL